MTVGRQEWPYVLNLANSIMGVSLLAMPFCFMRVSKITVTHTVNPIRFKCVVKVQVLLSNNPVISNRGILRGLSGLFQSQET